LGIGKSHRRHKNGRDHVQLKKSRHCKQTADLKNNRLVFRGRITTMKKITLVEAACWKQDHRMMQRKKNVT